MKLGGTDMLRNPLPDNTIYWKRCLYRHAAHWALASAQTQQFMPLSVPTPWQHPARPTMITDHTRLQTMHASLLVEAPQLAHDPALRAPAPQTTRESPLPSGLVVPET